MSAEEAKNYIQKHYIPQLFESLMTGLLYNRPENHIHYLRECLENIQQEGVEEVQWNRFIDLQRKSPLPPIQSDASKYIGDQDPRFITETPSKSLEHSRGTPLPPIGQSPRSESIHQLKDSLQDTPVVLLMGGPGSGRADYCKKLTGKFSGWEHISVGELLRRARNQSRDTAQLIANHVAKGELVPEKIVLPLLLNELRSKGKDARGIVIDGYPRTMEQVIEYEQQIGKVDLVFIVDYEEQQLRQNLFKSGPETGRPDNNTLAIDNRIALYKKETLPVMKHFDDLGKLIVIEGNRSQLEIYQNISSLMSASFPWETSGDNMSDLSGPFVPRPPSDSKVSSTASSRRGSGTKYSQQSSRPTSGFDNVPKSVELHVKDTGRKGSLPLCPIICVLGGPGSGRHQHCKQMSQLRPGMIHLSAKHLLQTFANSGSSSDCQKVKASMEAGELAPNHITVRLIRQEILKNEDARAFILDGYPASTEELEDFNDQIGGLSIAVLVDCDEQHMRDHLKKTDDTEQLSDRLISARISTYKHQTLPVLGYLDDHRKLIIIDGEQQEEGVFNDLVESLKMAFTMAMPDEPVSEQVATEQVSDIELRSNLIIDVPDTGRVVGMSKAPVIAIIGAPGSGVDALCRHLMKTYPDLVHLSNVNEEVLEKQFKEHQDAKGIVIENFPGNREDVELFNEKVGRMDAVVVIDCSEEHCLKNVPAMKTEIASYQQTSLPVLGHYDDDDKLFYVNGERDMSDIFADVSKIVEDVLSRDYNTSNSLIFLSSKSSLLRLNVSVRDSGRQPELPQCPLMAIVGIESALNNSLADTVTKQYSATVIQAQNKTIDELVSVLKEHGDSSLIIMTDYPMNSAQLEEFNQSVGGLTKVVIVDVSKQHALNHDLTREEIDRFRHETLPVVAHYDDLERLEVLLCDEDISELEQQLMGFVDRVLQSGPVPGAVEEICVKSSQVVTGDKGNIHYARELGLDINTNHITADHNKDDHVIDNVNSTKSNLDELEELEKCKIVFVLGGPGSGKGTQCDLIIKKYGFTHLSTGDLLREEVNSGSERGKQLTQIMERGELVPLETVLAMLKDAMVKNASSSKGFLIDGYPRELEQGKRFESDVCHVNGVIYFEVADETMKQRLMKRAEISGRADDNEETIMKRLKTFHQHSEPVIDYYGKQNKVCKIVAEGTIEEIFAKVDTYLQSI